jgi:UDP-N-acetylmuramyl pentapeptide phosphotransferase/UDP-N-acetylglucosamine-1-phosphate transferase
VAQVVECLTSKHETLSSKIQVLPKKKRKKKKGKKKMHIYHPIKHCYSHKEAENHESWRVITKTEPE